MDNNKCNRCPVVAQLEKRLARAIETIERFKVRAADGKTTDSSVAHPSQPKAQK